MSSSAQHVAFEHTAARSERLSTRILRWLQTQLARRAAPLVFAAVSTLILCLSCTTGLSADDYVHTLLLEHGAGIAGFDRAPWDIFRFATPEFTPLLQEAGIFAWWDDPRAKLAFLRPLSALTHVLDHTLFPDSPALMHLHSVLWGAITFAGVIALYRRLIGPGWLLGLSAFLYILDDARCWFSSWVAGRNTVVATALSVWTLWAHVRQRQKAGADRHGDAPPGLPYLGLLLFALALLAGEGSVAIAAYLLAYALFMDASGRRPALLALWPYAVLLGAWQVTYRALGYGVAASGLYVHPLTDPVAYGLRLLERSPVLLFSQLGGMWSDHWSSLFVFPTVRAVIYGLALVCIALFGYLIWPLVKQRPLVRFGLLGAGLALLPATATFPADRLLNWVSLGAAPAMATLIAFYLERLGPQDRRQRLGHYAAWAMIVVHMVVGPVAMLSRVRGNLTLRDILERADAGVPKDESIEQRQVFFLNPPAIPLASFLPIMRAVKGEPRPLRQLVLSVATTPLTVRRLDRHTLALSAPLSPIWNPGSNLLYGRDSGFEVGAERRFGEVRLRVTEVDETGAPLAFEAHFDRPLDDPGYLFLDWRGATYGTFAPPPVGEGTVLAPADYMQVVLGEKGPFEAYHPLARGAAKANRPLTLDEPTASRNRGHTRSHASIF